MPNYLATMKPIPIKTTNMTMVNMNRGESSSMSIFKAIPTQSESVRE
jgi:hypothetical protein